MNKRRTLLTAATSAMMTLGSILPVLAASEPVVGSISPTVITNDRTTEFSVSYNDPDGVAACDLYVDGVSRGTMTLSGGANSNTGTARFSTAFGTNGGSMAQVRCRDAQGNYGLSAMTRLTVGPSSPPAPVIGAAVSTGSTVNAATSFTATYTDTDAVNECMLYVDGENEGELNLVGSMTGTGSVSHTFRTVGQHEVQVRCEDAAGNVGHGPISVINVMPTSSSSAPVVGSFSSSLSGTVNQPVSFSASYSDSDGVNQCRLFIDGSQTSTSVSLSGGSASSAGNATATQTFSSPGMHTGYIRCTDASGNAGIGAMTSFNVYAAGGSGSGSGDTTAPTAPLNVTIQPGGGTTPTFGWTASTDAVGVTAYETSLDGAPYVRGTGSLSFTSTAPLSNGPHTFSVRALDAAGNASAVGTLSFTVSDTGSTPIVAVPISGVISLDIMNNDALFTFNAGSRADFETAIGRSCEWSGADATVKVNAALTGIVGTGQRTAIENFSACGTGGSLKLGAGERLGIINSFRAAFGRLPNSREDWFDVIKIGNGRFPGRTNADAEARAKVAFRKVYLRDADTSVTADNNAVTVMAYGLRPLPRNLNSEAAAVVTFKAVYGHNPSSATDWDIVRAIAYSGATR